MHGQHGARRPPPPPPHSNPTAATSGHSGDGLLQNSSRAVGELLRLRSFQPCARSARYLRTYARLHDCC